MPSYHLSPEAKKDLLTIHAYTRKRWGAQQAQKYIDALEKRCDELAQSPHMGRERPEIKPGYRSITEGKHVIFYRVGDSGIEILRIPHGRMDIEHHLGQTKT
ncbi:toxin ParE1 [bacterium BMS3Bbin11]|nr:toxin ParE1 [bacterium BMS3Bbin11]HDH08320.1 type II toxin-antitoxin system RelE/ParE family toxin [Gammaproteobacteria bacterium]HDH16626.1 type II toxin-antitoxin system RelE/ParE family toxin [Gammaproteobacteria bacterium]